MALFFPTSAVAKAYDITADNLRVLNVKGLILDIDNTLTTHDHPVPDDRILEWLDQMRKAGIQLILLSNNHPPRVAPFAQKLDPCVRSGRKKAVAGRIPPRCRRYGAFSESDGGSGRSDFYRYFRR